MKAKIVDWRKKFTTNDYKEYLTDIHGDIKICGITFDAGQILRTLRPHAFLAEYNKFITLYLERDTPDYQCSDCGGIYGRQEEAEECCT